MNLLAQSLHRQLEIKNNLLLQAMDLRMSGTIVKLSGFLIEAQGLHISIGAICSIPLGPHREIKAEVIGFSEDITYLMAYDEIQGILPGSPIRVESPYLQVPVGQGLLGRVLNGLGEPIDGMGPLKIEGHYPLQSPPMNPIHRSRITEPLDVGVRAINALLTTGKGQRMGIFAGSGVGKSMLLGMITRFTEADVVVVGLIGERGREVKECIEENIGPQHRDKTIIIAAPVDTSPLMRANGAMLATSIAEYFRDQGKNVLLIVDSLTRYAQALRQMYLSLGEIPSTKGFSPSVFARLSQLMERTGTGAADQGAITAFYTVLVEGDDLQDPVADHVRSVLDGHIVLTRSLADAGHYPAIDIGRSVSRVMHAIMTQDHAEHVLRFKRLFSAYQQNQDLIKMGMYQKGSDRSVDEALQYLGKMEAFLQQRLDEPSAFAEAIRACGEIFI